MGMFKLFSDGDSCAPNPDPRRFKILNRVDFGRCSSIIAHYSGCTTFGGRRAVRRVA